MRFQASSLFKANGGIGLPLPKFILMAARQEGGYTIATILRPSSGYTAPGEIADLHLFFL